MSAPNAAFVRMRVGCLGLLALAGAAMAAAGEAEGWKPYRPPQTEREDVFAFAEMPSVKRVGEDRYEISFAVKGLCDVTVAIVDPSQDPSGLDRGTVVRHLASGVLGSNAPAPFQKNSLKQTLHWNGKDDLDWYVDEPGKLAVRVMLGLRPEFDKRLGGTSPKNIPGRIIGLTVAPDSVYVSSTGGMFGHVAIRKFDRDGKYLQSLLPSPAHLPEEKLGGLQYVEYEPGKRAVHGVQGAATLSKHASYLPDSIASEIWTWQPVVKDGLFFFPNEGKVHGTARSAIYWMRTDGSTDSAGLQGLHLGLGIHGGPRLAASPDGKWIYAISSPWGIKHPTRFSDPVVMRAPADGSAEAQVFLGERKKDGSDNAHFNWPAGIDCDSEGRIYVADHFNSRIQIFSPDGKYLKSLKVDRPTLVFVHKKTGAIYVQHSERVQARSVVRITKFGPFQDPKKELYMDSFPAMAALDSWSAKPRLWLGSDLNAAERNFDGPLGPRSVTVWEERGQGFEKILDFEEEARREAGNGWFGRWDAVGVKVNGATTCDPVREKLYYGREHIFDLRTGKYEGRLALPGATTDLAFDKRGYMHAHFNPTFFMQGVGRFDPAVRTVREKRDKKTEELLYAEVSYAECPYDYGVPRGKLAGILPVKDQGGAKGFQDGLGVDMAGNIAVQTNIYHVPKMSEESWNLVAAEGLQARKATGAYVDGGAGGVYNNYARYMSWVAEQEKKGEEVYYVRRKPGIPLSGGTVWTFDRTGELRKECAVIAGDLMNGVQMDEDLALYFVNARPRLFDGKIFLDAKGGTFGMPRDGKGRWWPFTGTLIKTRPDAFCRILLRNATLPLEVLPERAPEVAAIDFPGDQHQKHGTAWTEGADWLYAGASPIVPNGCSCYTSRFHLDWYKRIYLPEAYRHAIGILDTNGNLILHLGRYGNFDSAPGGPQGAKPGGTDIGITCARFIGGTDHYLSFEDWGERIVVLRLAYHAEKTVPIGKGD